MKTESKYTMFKILYYYREVLDGKSEQVKAVDIAVPIIQHSTKY